MLAVALALYALGNSNPLIIYWPINSKLHGIPTDPREIHEQGRKRKDQGALSVTVWVKYTDDLDLRENQEVIDSV